MDRAKNYRFSGQVTVFQERRLPERATPAGYAALIDAYAPAFTHYLVGCIERVYADAFRAAEGAQ